MILCICDMSLAQTDQNAAVVSGSGNAMLSGLGNCVSQGIIVDIDDMPGCSDDLDPSAALPADGSHVADADSIATIDDSVQPGDLQAVSGIDVADHANSRGPADYSQISSECPALAVDAFLEVAFQDVSINTTGQSE